MTILLNRTLRLFLDGIGRREEYDYYIKKFQSDETAAFAILAPDRAGFEEVVAMFAFDMEFLIRLELSPIILLAGPQAKQMRDLMFIDHHPYTSWELPENSEWSTQLPSLLSFLKMCRQQHRVGIVLTPQLSLKEALLGLVPGIARRVHFLRVKGQLRSAGGEHLFYYYTSRPVPLDKEDLPMAKLAAELLEQRPGSHLSVASPWALLSELFTVKGAGSIVRRGSRILRQQRGDDMDKVRLATLLEESFGKKLLDTHSIEEADEVYREEHYYGASFLERHPAGMYLSKFAVGTDARGGGLAQELWREMTKDHKSLFWRAKPNNPINRWYEKEADGFYKGRHWRVFWRNVDIDRLPEIIHFCLDRREDFLST